MAKNLNGLDILLWVTKVRPDFGLRFSLGPFLHTTLIVDMRWTIIAQVKINLSPSIPPPKKKGIFDETPHCLLRKPNFFLVCQQKIGILRLFLIFFIKSKRNRNKLWSCFRTFQDLSIFQKQLHNLFRFSQKSSKEAKTLPKNVCLDWHTENNLKRPPGTVWHTQKRRFCKKWPKT